MKKRMALPYCSKKCCSVLLSDWHTPSRMATEGTTTMNFVQP